MFRSHSFRSCFHIWHRCSFTNHEGFKFFWSETRSFVLTCQKSGSVRVLISLHVILISNPTKQQSSLRYAREEWRRVSRESQPLLTASYESKNAGLGTSQCSNSPIGLESCAVEDSRPWTGTGELPMVAGAPLNQRHQQHRGDCREDCREGCRPSLERKLSMHADTKDMRDMMCTMSSSRRGRVGVFSLSCYEWLRHGWSKPN